MIKKNATLTSVVLSLILVFGIFIGSYLWMNWNAEDSGITLDSKYGNVYSNLSSQQTSLESNINDIREAVKNIVEPESIYQMAMNGLKGLLYVLKLPLTFVDTAVSSYLTIGTLVEIPSFVKSLITLSIIATIVLLIVAILKGEPKV